MVKLVLITRLTAGSASQAELSAWMIRMEIAAVGRRVVVATRSRPLTVLRADDPLPPEDHVPGPGPESVAGLYRAHGKALARFLRRQAGGQHAPDLLHRVFTRFLGLAPHKRAAIVSSEAYLKTTARNLVRDERKLAQRRQAAAHLSDEIVPVTAPCQIAALEARDMLNRIELSIQKLKPITREIFLAHRLDGYSYAQIAERTGLSVKGVEKHMSRAIAHIDRFLGPR